MEPYNSLHSIYHGGAADYEIRITTKITLLQIDDLLLKLSNYDDTDSDTEFTFVENDQSFVENDKSFLENDPVFTFVENDQSFLENDQSFLENEHTFTFVENEEPVMNGFPTFVDVDNKTKLKQLINYIK